ncbi:hypothetical protein D3C80_1808480 [compost metagenome]
MRQHVAGRQVFTPQPGAKTARIGITQRHAVTDHQINVVVLTGFGFLGQHTQAAGHPQMDDNPTLVQFNQQILGAALHAAYRPVAQRQNLLGNRPAQPRIAHHSILNAMANKIRFNPTSAGLNFW